MKKILLAEDEMNIASFLQRGLTESGYKVTVCQTGLEALDIFQEEDFELLILDIIMPGISGLEVCRHYRERYGYGTPIIMLTALNSTEDIVKGLDAGADDYLGKPFSFAELEARIKALLRRNLQTTPSLLTCGDLTFDSSSQRAYRKQQYIELTVKEARLLEYFLTHQGEVLDRLTLLKNVWDKNFDTNTNIVDVYVNYLRNKIDKDFTTKLIHTVVGKGYRMEKI